MNNLKDIIAVTKFVVSDLERIDDVVDNALAPIKDYKDTLSDLIAPIRALAGVHNLARRMKLKGFLKNYAKLIKAGESPNELTLKLEKYLSKLKNAELITQAIEQAIAAKSVRCSCMLGFFAGDILSKSVDATYRDFLVINGLSNLIDEDIDNFLSLYERLAKIDRKKELRICLLEEELKSINVPSFQLELTVEKLKGSLLLGFDIGGYGKMGNAWGAFVFNENSDYLYSLIKRCGV